MHVDGRMGMPKAGAEALDPEDLLEAVAAGNRAAFRKLYDDFGPTLYGICVRLMRDRELARDALQEAMLRIWQKARLFDRSKGRAIAWMITLTRRHALDRIAANPPSAASLADNSVMAIVEGMARPSDPTAAADIWRCLPGLEEKFRKSILLTYYYGLSYAEVSERLAAPIGSVKTWIHRGVALLRACLEK